MAAVAEKAGRYVVGDVSQEPSTFKASTTDYQPKNIMITGGAGFIVISTPHTTTTTPLVSYTLPYTAPAILETDRLRSLLNSPVTAVSDSQESTIVK